MDSSLDKMFEGRGVETTDQKTHAKNENLCDEKKCQNPIAYKLKFQSGRLGYYCQHHKDLFEKWGILAKTTSAQKREKYHS